ncbi:hypothetical protein [Marinoscillum furvescens]|uniref:Uncharacterized protein n=1 Tax=Marinoscillum furvescens DSM 4134 TaxID=1122208 RepID=A0A3D9KZQ5_MARFU|nr:hypothetical protein [Marinoscillum furvescens]RED96127.1 hypothetical protein C7460_11516 [Marinoscillum furvescens DSM 4134]
MTRFLRLTGVFLLMSVGMLDVAAQDTAEDPYADYSYLWEDPKAKAKEAKRKAKEEKKRQKELEKMRKQGLLPDTTRQAASAEPARLDSIPEQTIPLDSMQAPADTIPDPEPQQPQPTPTAPDTLDKPEPQQPEIEEMPEPEEKAKKPKKEKRDLSGPPVQDFRSGMASSSGGGSFNGGFTFTQIDDQYFVGMVLSPEFSIGKVGVGLNVPVLYGLDDQSIRTEIFKDGVGAARLITYIRYGVQKADPVYVKVGQLNNTMIGFGGLINNYTNTTSFEKRKLGLHYDFNIKGLAGVDGLYSDFNPESFNLFAIRPYVRPLAWTPLPIIRTLEMGTTIVRDKDQTQLISSDSTSSSYLFTRDGIGAFGLDLGMTLLRVPFIQIDFFANYSRLNVSSTALTDSLAADYTQNGEPEAMADSFQNGHGTSVGVNFRFHFIADILSTDIRLERLNNSEHYVGQFFDATYEINKDARIYSLGEAQKMSGFYGSLTGHILHKVRLGGALMLPDEISDENPATVRVNADLDRLADKFSFHGSYIKGNLSTLDEAFTFDERSLAKLRVIYHLNKFLAAGLDYYWAFTPTADGSYKPTKYVSPYFGLSIDF